MTARWSRRRIAVAALVTVVLGVVAVIAVAAARRSDVADAPSESGGVHGPLCDALPSGDDPGSPAAIAELDASVALTWIPVLTVFEAGTRAAGLTSELAESGGITILAPSDDAFLLAMTQETLDELIISRQDELRELLESHIVDGQLSVTDLVTAGSVTTLSGDTFEVDAAGSEAVVDGRAAMVCSDYRVANATIHVIDAVLGELPAPAPPAEPAHE